MIDDRRMAPKHRANRYHQTAFCVVFWLESSRASKRRLQYRFNSYVFIVHQFLFFIFRPLNLVNLECRLQIGLLTYRSVFECIKKRIVLDE